MESGYVQMLEDEGTLEAEGRVRNLEEFVSAAVESEGQGLRLAEFLETGSLWPRTPTRWRRPPNSP